VLRPLSASELLDLWERGIGVPPVEQGLLLLQAAYPEIPASHLLDLSIGQRDAILMRLRDKTFGASLSGLAVCPSCGEKVEISFPLVQLYANGGRYTDPLTLSSIAQPKRIETGGFELSFRLPNSRDLLRLPADSESARLTLLQTCVLDARRAGQPVDASDLSDDVVETLTRQMDDSDPLANLHLPLNCPACKHSWEVMFDILSFFWSEINAWAQRLLRELHILASAYGWREADILAMSAWRRQKYLELIGV
jgi:hypothetical protein